MNTILKLNDDQYYEDLTDILLELQGMYFNDSGGDLEDTIAGCVLEVYNRYLDQKYNKGVDNGNGNG